jgi:hypothetical protein
MISIQIQKHNNNQATILAHSFSTSPKFRSSLIATTALQDTNYCGECVWSCKLAIFKDVATQGKILTSGNTVLKATLQPPSLLSANPMELKWFLS